MARRRRAPNQTEQERNKKGADFFERSSAENFSDRGDRALLA